MSGDTFYNWTAWKREFDLFATATGLSQQPKDVQAATLLMTIGEDARRTFYTFKFDSEDDKKDLRIISAKFEANFKPSENLTFNEFRFGSRDQEEGESFNEWLTQLRILAGRCEFGELEERLIRSRIILGIKDKDFQQKLLSENPSFSKVVQMCRAREQAKEQLLEIRARTDNPTIAAIKENTAPCTRCGLEKHKYGKCAAQGKHCNNCGRSNHFARVCRQPKQTPRSAAREVKQVVLGVEDEYFLKALEAYAISSEDRWSAKIVIAGSAIECKIDTGANCCVMPEVTLRKLTMRAAMLDHLARFFRP